MRVRATLACLAGLVLLAAPSPSAQRRLPPAPSLYELLDRYAAGDIGAARTFASLPNLERTVRVLEEQGARWVNADRSAVARRRLVAATFVLDAARELLGSTNWSFGRRLIAWGCHQLGPGSGPPQSGEHWWYLSSVALIEGAEDWPLLVGRQPVAGRKSAVGRGALEDEVGRGHLTHAELRFPGESRFALAAAIAAENRSWEVGGFSRDPNRRGMIAGEIPPEMLALELKELDGETNGTSRPRPQARLGPAHWGRIAEVRSVARQYAALAEHEPIAAEVHLRFGLVSFRLADSDRALVHLDRVAQLTEDPHLLYLGRLLTGLVRERQGRDDDAVTAYRAALQIVPRAQSATTLLAARLARLGRLAEAASLAESFFAFGPPPDDPWRTYRTGDFRSWPDLMARLRAELR